MAGRARIGILTFHRCINYGSYWQARCLAEGLRALGHEAVLLDHRSAAVDRREWRCALEPLLPRRSPAGDRTRYAAKTRRFFGSFGELPLSPPFELDRPQAWGEWDVVIVGSDEVWNLQHPWYGGHGTFYGYGIEVRRLVSYAASFGNQQFGLPPFCADALSHFAMISVRDDNSASIVREALGDEPETVLDPCLQFPPVLDAPHSSGSDRPRVVVYGHSFPDWFATVVRAWSQRKGYRLSSVGYRNDWADEQIIDAGPLDFARAMAGAQAVVTNFFHGCVFALVNGKPFACVPSDYRSNKVTGLMRLLSAERHLVDEPRAQSVETLLDTALPAELGQRIAGLRVQSRRFIERAVTA
jgi:hypothetical protein